MTFHEVHHAKYSFNIHKQYSSVLPYTHIPNRGWDSSIYHLLVSDTRLKWRLLSSGYWVSFVRGKEVAALS